MLLCDGQCRFLFNLWSSFTANRHWYDCSFISADHKHNPFFHSALMPQYSRLILTINFNYIAIFLVSAYLIGLPISSCRRRRFRLNMRNDRELVFYDKSAMVNCRKRASMQLTIRKSIISILNPLIPMDIAFGQIEIVTVNTFLESPFQLLKFHTCYFMINWTHRKNESFYAIAVFLWVTERKNWLITWQYGQWWSYEWANGFNL